MLKRILCLFLSLTLSIGLFSACETKGDAQQGGETMENMQKEDPAKDDI